VQKIISERCELVKLRHINCSGPVFFETHCIEYIALVLPRKKTKYQVALLQNTYFINEKYIDHYAPARESEGFTP